MNSAEFQVERCDLCAGRPELGSVALLPWDARIFGFPVGEYQPGELAQVAARPEEVRAALHAWAGAGGVELCACSVPATDAGWVALLPHLGFVFVDFNIRVTLNRFQLGALPQPRLALRPAQPEDHAGIQRLAEQAFRFGRYHADARFPKVLADLRYRRWMENALSGNDACSFVYVMGKPGCVQGFYHVTLRDSVADLRLAAVEADLQRTLLGFDLYAAILVVLKEAGARQVVSKISSANTAVMNVYAALGFRFSSPEAVFHWHAPHAPHLKGDVPARP